MSRPSDSLTVTIDRFEEHRAVLLFPGGQAVSVSRRFVPKSAKEGDVLTVELLTNEQQTKRQANLARAILDEILQGQ